MLHNCQKSFSFQDTKKFKIYLKITLKWKRNIFYDLKIKAHMEMTQKWVGLADEEGLHGRLSHCRQQSWTQSWKCKWTVDQHLALADCYHVGIWAWRFSIDARNMDFHVKHQDFFFLFPSYRVITYVSCFSNECVVVVLRARWQCKKSDTNTTLPPLPKINNSMIVVYSFATKNK